MLIEAFFILLRSNLDKHSLTTATNKANAKTLAEGTEGKNEPLSKALSCSVVRRWFYVQYVECDNIAGFSGTKKTMLNSHPTS